VELPLRTADVAGWLTARYGPHSAVRVGKRVPLVGGLGSALVERVELLVTLEDQRRRRVALVVKRTDEPEVQALRLLAELAEEGIPELISVGGDEAGQWIVIPFYDGEEVGLMGEPPPSAYEVIARVHAHFQASAADLSASFERVDSAFCARSLGDFAQRAVIESRAQIGAHPVLDRASALASRFACDADLVDGPNRFPWTLLHGDLYGMNVLRASETHRSPVLLDWNCARVGPAMFDVAMGVGPGSAAHDGYAAAWEHAAGQALDRVQAATGYAWASALVNATFAGVVAGRGSPTDAATMLDEAERALADYHDRIGGRRS